MVPWESQGNLNSTRKTQGGALSDGVQKPKKEVQEVITAQAGEGVNLFLWNFLSLQGEYQARHSQSQDKPVCHSSHA